MDTQERRNWRVKHWRSYVKNTVRRYINDRGFSLKPYDKHHCIFVHIPKCAGMSVTRSLFGENSGGAGHLTMTDYLGIFSAQDMENYFKFSIVRNPWSRLVSAYTFMKKGGLHSHDAAWAAAHLAEYDDFKSFVHGWLNETNIYKGLHFMPQHHFLLHEGDTDLSRYDFIGYQENLDEDFPIIAQAINSPGQLKPVNVTGRKRNYTNFYDEETKEIVANIYRKDIELLGYNFDNSSLPEMIAARDKNPDFVTS